MFAHGALPKCAVAVLDDCSIAVCAHGGEGGAVAKCASGNYEPCAIGCLPAPHGEPVSLMVVGRGKAVAAKRGKKARAAEEHALLVYRVTPASGGRAASAELHTVVSLAPPSRGADLISASFHPAPVDGAAPTLSLLWSSPADEEEHSAVLEVVRPTLEQFAEKRAYGGDAAPAALRRTVPGVAAEQQRALATAAGDGFVVLLRHIAQSAAGSEGVAAEEDSIAVNTWGTSYGVPVAATSISLGPRVESAASTAAAKSRAAKKKKARSAPAKSAGGLSAAMLSPPSGGEASIFKGDKGTKAYVALALGCTVLLHSVPAAVARRSSASAVRDDLATALGCLAGAQSAPTSHDLPVRRVDVAAAVQRRASAAAAAAPVEEEPLAAAGAGALSAAATAARDDDAARAAALSTTGAVDFCAHAERATTPALKWLAAATSKSAADFARAFESKHGRSAKRARGAEPASARTLDVEGGSVPATLAEALARGDAERFVRAARPALSSAARLAPAFANAVAAHCLASAPIIGATLSTLVRGGDVCLGAHPTLLRAALRDGNVGLVAEILLYVGDVGEADAIAVLDWVLHRASAEGMEAFAAALGSADGAASTTPSKKSKKGGKAAKKGKKKAAARASETGSKTGGDGAAEVSGVSLATDVLMQLLVACPFNRTFLRQSMSALDGAAVRFVLLFLLRHFSRLTRTSSIASSAVTRNITHVTRWLSALLEAHAAALIGAGGADVAAQLERLRFVVEEQVELGVKIAPLQGACAHRVRAPRAFRARAPRAPRRGLTLAPSPPAGTLAHIASARSLPEKPAALYSIETLVL